jgi:hypothetical protein
MKKTILVIACLALLGCERDGQMATIFREGNVVTDTQCDKMVNVLQTPDSLIVQVMHDYGWVLSDIAKFAYKNGMEYRVVVKGCTYKDDLL